MPTPTPTPVPTPTPTPADTIVVNASASLAGGIGAHFNLVVDGNTIGGATVGTAPQGFSFNTSLATGQGHDIQVVFDNDAFTGGEDRNLFLQSIAINGNVIPATSNLEVYHAPFNPGPGDLIGNGNMYWNGAAEFNLPASLFPAPTPTPVPTPTPTPTNTLTVTAHASLANGIGAHFNLLLDNVKVGEAVVGTPLQSFNFSIPTVTPGSAHDIKIVYDNDAVIAGQDRNLLLESITFQGETIAATDAREVYHATAGPGDFASSGNMFWGGTAEFILPASGIIARSAALAAPIEASKGTGSPSAVLGLPDRPVFIPPSGIGSTGLAADVTATISSSPGSDAIGLLPPVTLLAQDLLPAGLTVSGSDSGTVPAGGASLVLFDPLRDGTMGPLLPGHPGPS